MADSGDGEGGGGRESLRSGVGPEAGEETADSRRGGEHDHKRAFAAENPPRDQGRRALLRAALALALVGTAGCVGAGGPVPGSRVIEDVLGDDHGPGSYVPPQGEGYARGGFDLRRLTLTPDGDTLVVTAELARPVPQLRGGHLGTDVTFDAFLPTVDVYLDLDLAPGSGRREGLPGRRVRLADDAGWEVALVLGPAPGLARRVLAVDDARVIVADGVRARGSTLTGRVPASVLAGRPLAGIGVAAAVTATVVTATFRDLVPGQMTGGLTREVTAEPGRCGAWEEQPDGTPCTFGGCAPCGDHPRVLDALHPVPGVQEALLGAYAIGGAAEIPVVRPEGSPVVSPSRPGRPLAEVVDRRGTLVTARGEPSRIAALRAGQLLDGLGADGRVVATLMVVSTTETSDGGVLVLRVVDTSAPEGTGIVHIALP